MKKMKKKATITLLVSLIMLLTAACGNKSDAGADSAPAADAASEAAGASEEEEVPFRDQGLWYMGGLKSNEEGFDMNLALFRIDGEPVAVFTDGSEMYYGDYETEDTKFDDGTEWTLIKVGGKQFGYHFNDDNTGFLVDNDDNIIQAAELEEDRANEILDATGLYSEGSGESNFVEEQSGVSDFKDYDDIIAHLKPGQGYAYIKLFGMDGDILAVTQTVFEADNSTCDADLYCMKDGKPMYMSYVAGNGSAYPLRLADGILYAGDNHSYETYFVSSENNSLMMKDCITDGVNDGTNKYMGFLRETNDYDHDKDFTGGAKEFEALIAERDAKPIIEFTKVS